jgi:hypothetical protein
MHALSWYKIPKFLGLNQQFWYTYIFAVSFGIEIYSLKNSHIPFEKLVRHHLGKGFMNQNS